MGKKPPGAGMFYPFLFRNMENIYKEPNKQKTGNKIKINTKLIPYQRRLLLHEKQTGCRGAKPILVTHHITTGTGTHSTKKRERNKEEKTKPSRTEQKPALHKCYTVLRGERGLWYDL